MKKVYVEPSMVQEQIRVATSLLTPSAQEGTNSPGVSKEDYEDEGHAKSRGSWDKDGLW